MQPLPNNVTRPKENSRGLTQEPEQKPKRIMKTKWYVFMAVTGIFLLCLPIIIDYILLTAIRSNVEKQIQILIEPPPATSEDVHKEDRPPKIETDQQGKDELDGMTFKVSISVYNITDVMPAESSDTVKYPLKFKLLDPRNFHMAYIDRNFTIISMNNLSEPFVNINLVKVVSYWLYKKLDELTLQNSSSNQDKQLIENKNIIGNVNGILGLYPSLFYSSSIHGIVRLLKAISTITDLPNNSNLDVKKFAEIIISVNEYMDTDKENNLIYKNSQIFINPKVLTNTTTPSFESLFTFKPIKYLPLVPSCYILPYFTQIKWLYNKSNVQSEIVLQEYSPTSDWIKPSITNDFVKMILNYSGVILTDQYNAKKGSIINIISAPKCYRNLSFLSILFPVGIPVNMSLGFIVEVLIPQEESYGKLQSLKLPYAQICITLQDHPQIYKNIIPQALLLRQWIYIILFLLGGSLLLITMIIALLEYRDIKNPTITRKEDTAPEIEKVVQIEE